VEGAELLSGQYPARVRITRALQGDDIAGRAPWKKLQPLPPSPMLGFDQFTLGEALKEAGYATALLGKWHLGTESGGSGYAIKDPKDIASIQEHYGFDIFDPGDAKQLDIDKGVTDLTDREIHFIESHHDQSFFLFLSHHSVHTYCEAPEPIVQKYLDKGFIPTGHYPYEGIDSATYLAMIEHLDNETGRLLEKVKSLALDKNTVLVFMSDNGGVTRVTQNDPLRRGKATCYEGGVRVPLIIRQSGTLRSGQTCDDPVHIIDLYPTFLELAGLSDTAVRQHLDGESLVPVLQGTGSLAREDLFWHIPHYICYPLGGFRTTPHSAIRSGDYKRIEFFGDYFEYPSDANKNNLVFNPNLARYIPEPKVELFNLKQDLAERNDLSAQMPEKTKELLQRLHKWRESVGAAIPVANPTYDPTASFISTFIPPQDPKK